jgi:hypothetical protein
MVGKLDVVVSLKARTCGNLLAHNNVGLKVDKVIRVALDRGLGKTPAVRINDALDSQESMELATLSVPKMAGSASGGVPPARVMLRTVSAKM